MLRRSIIFIGVALIALGLAIILPGNQRTAAQDQTTVNMQDFEFQAKDITIKVGDSIVWKNAGAKKHTATGDDNGFDTDVVAPGASSQPIKFDKAGTFKYFCQFHGGPGGVDMSGTITVVDAAPAAPAAVATEAPAAPAVVPAGKPVGNVTFADKGKGAHGDSVTFTITSLPLPEEGKQYEAWLSNEKAWFSLGKLDVKADGTASLNYVDPNGANLIGQFQSALISEQGNDLTPAGPILYSGTIPPQALIHVRHVAVSFPDTPEKIGLMAGALEQDLVLVQHVAFMNDAIAKGNLALAKRHLEHIHNLMTGNNGAVDVDGNGKLEVIPPGDGFGIFGYLTTAVQHADLAAKQPDASSNVKVKANHVKITAGNATGNFTQIQALALQGASKGSLADLKPIAAQITKLSDAALKGVPDATGGISPTKGSGGLATAYNEGLAMATIALLPGDITGGKGEPAPGGSAAPVATEAAAAPPAAADTVTVTVKDFEFVDKTITIKPGQSVIFVNQGTKKHTATADDSSFDTGVLAPGASSAPIAFPKGGTFQYFCQFHGGPGGLDMAGVVEVK